MILICGIARAGKTTYAQRFGNVIHLDDYPQPRFTNCNKAISKMKGEIIVEGVYVTKKSRMNLLKSVKTKDKRTCIWIDTSLDVALKRGGRKKKAIRKIAETFEPPTLDEGWDEIVIVKGEQEWTQL